MARSTEKNDANATTDRTASGPQGQSALGGEELRSKLKVHAGPELEYRYRDLFNVFIGPESVLLEFGTQHRSTPGEATMYDRIVLSPGNAAQLVQVLAQSLETRHRRLREMQQQAETDTDGASANNA